MAEKKSHAGISKLLIQYHSLVEKRAESDGSFLHCAVIDCLEAIKVGRSDVAKQHRAAYLANIDKKMKIIEILLNSKLIDANTLNSQNETILHLVCGHHSSFHWSEELKQLIVMIVDNGVDVNCRNHEGKTALIIASENGLTSIVSLLLERNGRWNTSLLNKLLYLYRCPELDCDVNVVDNSGETAAMKAEQRNHFEIVRLFIENDLLLAVENGDKKEVQAFLDRHYLDYKRGIRPLESVKYEFNNGHVVMITDIFPRSRAINLSTLQKAERWAAFNGKLEIDLMLIDNDFLDHYYGFRTFFFMDLDVILKSGKFSTNAIDAESNTLLHILSNACAINYNHECQCSGEHKTRTIDTHTELLLWHKANVNARNSSGGTALMLASWTGCTSIVYTILTWTKKKCIWIDLDAQDADGKTALMIAARNKHPDVVKLLLDAGASICLMSIFRHNSLHYALSEITSSLTTTIIGFCPRDNSELATRRILLSRFTKEPDFMYGRDRIQLNKDTAETVRLLLQKSDIDVNAFDIEGYSPLDRAVVFLGDLSSTIQALKQKGAKLKVFQQDRKITVGHNMLHRFAVSVSGITTEDCYSLCKRCVTKIFETFCKQSQIELVTAKDSKGRTPLHIATIFGDHPWDVVAALILFGCRVNETDNFRRTPLHYTQRKEVADLLLENGADPTTRDIDEIGAFEMYEMRAQQSCWSLLKKGLAEELSSSSSEVKSFNGPIPSIHFEGSSGRETIFDEGLCTQNDFETRKLATSKINHEVKEFLEKLAKETKSRDRRYEFRVVSAGSGYEGTKIYKPNEFDFLLVLTNLSSLCEVLQSPELPPGYVKLKRKENCLEKIREDGFEEFFKMTGILDTEKVNSHFVLFIFDTIRDSKLFENKRACDWDSNRPTQFSAADTSKYGFVFSTLILGRTQPVVGKGLLLDSVSVDIVPCIHIEGWWPDEALPIENDSPNLGCYLVLQNPQRNYPWIPYSGPCARISHAPFESEKIKNSSITAKFSYMIVKEMIKSSGKLIKKQSSYVLKTCFLYCIEAFTPTEEMASKRGLTFDELESHFRQLSIQFWLRNLTKCLLQFVFQDFCPTYFIPSCYSPIGDSLKRNHIRLSTEDDVRNIIELYKSVFNFYRLSSTKEDRIYAELPTVNPVWETFDRGKLIAELSEEALSEIKLLSK